MQDLTRTKSLTTPSILLEQPQRNDPEGVQENIRAMFMSNPSFLVRG